MLPRLLIATTVPETLAIILRDQPRYLAQHFDLALVTSPGDEFDRLLAEGVPVHQVPMQRGISPLNDFWSVCRMVWLMLRLRPQLVHSYTPKAGLVCMLAGWVCRVPVRVHTFTGLIWPTAQGWQQRLLKAVDRLLCACATHIVPEGAGVQLDLQAGRITQKPLQVIGYGNIAGVDVAHFSPQAPELDASATGLREAFGIQDTDFVFVFVGRLNRDKGLDELLAAFIQLPEHSRLLVVGGLDQAAPIGAGSLHILESNPRIHWLGFQEDVRPALQTANVLVLPSYREGFPNVLLQAGAMELPVVATDIGGCNEAITHGLNGWLVPVKDVQALASAMNLALSLSPKQLDEMGQAARARIVERFERGEHWQRMLAFYRSLVWPGMNSQPTRKILLIASLAESVMNFRADLLRALQVSGFEVHVAAPGLEEAPNLKQHLLSCDWQVHSIPLQRAGMNPVADLRTVWALYRLMRNVKPNVVFPYTIKPVIYGTLAAWMAQVPGRFAMVTGLGYTFMGHAERSALAALVKRMYRFTLGKTQKVFFQNPDDQALFRSLGLLRSLTPSRVVNGSGVDVAAFAVAPMPVAPHFLLIARLQGDKGVREFVQAAKRVKAQFPHARFSLVGWIDESPDAIAQAELDAWVKTGTVEFLGRLSDVRPAIAACSVYVLPSYREGTPRTVLEAMAMGRAVITTDAPGCRETVVDGDNGFLVPVKSVDALADAMTRFITEPNLAARMGQRGRQMAEDKYDVHKVNAVMLKEMGLA